MLEITKKQFKELEDSQYRKEVTASGLQVIEIKEEFDNAEAYNTYIFRDIDDGRCYRFVEELYNCGHEWWESATLENWGDEEKMECVEVKEVETVVTEWVGVKGE